MVQAHPRARHQTWRGSDIDRGFGAINPDSSSAMRVVGVAANHCRQSSHQTRGQGVERPKEGKERRETEGGFACLKRRLSAQATGIV